MHVNIFFLAMFLVHHSSQSLDEDDTKFNGGRKTVSAVEDELYDKLMKIVEDDVPQKLTHDMSKQMRKVYYLLRSVKFYVKFINDPVNGGKTKRLTVQTGRDEWRIVPRLMERKNIIEYFYTTFKGEGARKLNNRIKQVYTGIPREHVQEWLNSNEDHFRHNPIFTNKPPLKPITAHSVQSTNQIDLVSMESFPVEKDGDIFTYVLSVLDVFSRFIHLRALTGKESNEVVLHLKEIFR